MRDNLIRFWLEQDVPKREICRRLDKAGISPTRKMQELGVTSWVVAWDDPEIRPNVQTIFTKAKHP